MWWWWSVRWWWWLRRGGLKAPRPSVDQRAAARLKISVDARCDALALLCHTGIISVTDDVSQSPMGWLKEVALRNMLLREEGLCGGGGGQSGGGCGGD